MFVIPSGFTQLERLGDGSFGRVELLQREDDGVLFAVKVFETPAAITTAEKEIDLMNLVSSPFIVKLYDVYRTPESVGILMDPCLGGSLRLKIASKSPSNPFTFNEIIEITTQLLLALKEIHKNGYAHRDLSPSNILFCKEKSNRIQLIDFGVSEYVGKGEARGTAGTPNYMSLEMKKGLPHNQMTDMYSLGLIIFEMCELRLPRPGETTSESQPSLDALIENLLSEDPSSRPNVEDCLSFPDVVDILDRFNGAKRIQLTAYDWRPSSDHDDDDSPENNNDQDFNLDFEDLPPIESSAPVTPGRLLDNGVRKHWRDPDFEKIQDAERVAIEEKERVEHILQERKEAKIAYQQKQRANSKLSKMKWNEQKGDLAKHGAEYNKRLEQVKKQPRQSRLLLNSAQAQAVRSSHDEFKPSADEIEKVTYGLEKILGYDKTVQCIKALDDNPLLSPGELGVTPRIFDILSKLMRLKKELFCL